MPRKTMEALQRHPWPGNVRELRNVIEHAAIITTGDTLRVPTLDEAAASVAAPSPTLADAERDAILRALESSGWRVKGPKGAAAVARAQPVDALQPHEEARHPASGPDVGAQRLGPGARSRPRRAKSRPSARRLLGGSIAFRALSTPTLSNELGRASRSHRRCGTNRAVRDGHDRRNAPDPARARPTADVLRSSGRSKGPCSTQPGCLACHIYEEQGPERGRRARREVGVPGGARGAPPLRGLPPDPRRHRALGGAAGDPLRHRVGHGRDGADRPVTRDGARAETTQTGEKP